MHAQTSISSGKIPGIDLIYSLMSRWSILDKLEPALAKKFANDRDGLTEQLVLRNVHMVLWMIKRFHIVNYKSYDTDDFISTCFLGLVVAAMKFKPGYGAPFRNYAIGVMTTHLIKEWKARDLEAERMKMVYLESLKGDTSEGEDEDGCCAAADLLMRKCCDTTVVNFPDVLSEIYEKDKKTICKNFMSYVMHSDRLTDNAKHIFKVLYASNFNCELVAKVTKKSRQRIHFIMNRVFRLLRAKYNKKSDEYKKIAKWREKNGLLAPLPMNLV